MPGMSILKDDSEYGIISEKRMRTPGIGQLYEASEEKEKSYEKSF